jgi:hypothetical protein
LANIPDLKMDTFDLFCGFGFGFEKGSTPFAILCPGHTPGRFAVLCHWSDGDFHGSKNWCHLVPLFRSGATLFGTKTGFQPMQLTDNYRTTRSFIKLLIPLATVSVCWFHIDYH